MHNGLDVEKLGLSFPALGLDINWYNFSGGLLDSIFQNLQNGYFL